MDLDHLYEENGEIGDYKVTLDNYKQMFEQMF